MKYLMLFVVAFLFLFSVPAFAEDKNVITVSDATFANEISKGVVVVDFAATWCGPCRRLAPIFEQFADCGVGKFKAIHCDVDACPRTAEKYEVNAIPMRITFKDGVEVSRHTGISIGSEANNTWRLLNVDDLIDQLKEVTGVEVDKPKVASK